MPAMHLPPTPALLALLTLFALPAHADPAMASGGELYQRFCASCHGADGRGDGPAAAALDPSPGDLTTIAHRRSGRFPIDEIHEIIDGRARLPAHGTRTMPVWGYEFEAGAPQAAPGRAAAQSMTQRLVTYLQSLQR